MPGDAPPAPRPRAGRAGGVSGRGVCGRWGGVGALGLARTPRPLAAASAATRRFRCALSALRTGPRRTGMSRRSLAAAVIPEERSATSRSILSRVVVASGPTFHQNRSPRRVTRRARGCILHFYATSRGPVRGPSRISLSGDPSGPRRHAASRRPEPPRDPPPAIVRVRVGRALVSDNNINRLSDNVSRTSRPSRGRARPRRPAGTRFRRPRLHPRCARARRLPLLAARAQRPLLPCSPV